jgi:S-adenosylmethionine hydrolase
MAIITFMSDFGHREHYVAAVKAKIYSINPNINVVDISHHIEHFNISHGAFVLRSVYKDFPKGTVHLVSVNAPNKDQDKLMAFKFEDHYFVGVDNGLFSLLSDKPIMTVAVELNRDAISGVFPEKTVLAAAAVALASGASIYNLGIEVQSMKQMLNRQLRITKTQIVGHVIHVDHYGNLITNISREVIETVRNERPYTISFGREMTDVIAASYNVSDHGDVIALYNSNGYLEISISLGNAAELLGLGYDSPVSISFVPQDSALI